MAGYEFQTFTPGEILGAVKLNQIGKNVELHTHGKDSEMLMQRVQHQIVALAQSGPNVAWNCLSGHHALAPVSGNVTVGNPTNLLSGSHISVELRHMVANNSIAFASAWSFPGSISPATSQTSGDRDLIQGFCPDGVRIRGYMIGKFRGF